MRNEEEFEEIIGLVESAGCVESGESGATRRKTRR
jgi:hypothetical protein